MTMKRFATTLLMAMAAAGAWSGTVRMGALSTDTTVETLDLNVLKDGGRLLAQFAAAASAEWEDELWT